MVHSWSKGGLLFYSTLLYEFERIVIITVDQVVNLATTRSTDIVVTFDQIAAIARDYFWPILRTARLTIFFIRITHWVVLSFAVRRHTWIHWGLTSVRASFLLDFQAVANFELIKPAFARNEVATRWHLDCHFFHLASSNCSSLLNFITVPFVQLSLHLRVFCLTATTLFAFTADFDPSLERLKRHLVKETAITRTFFICKCHCFTFQISCEHPILLSWSRLGLVNLTCVQVIRKLPYSIWIFLLNRGRFLSFVFDFLGFLESLEWLRHLGGLDEPHELFLDLVYFNNILIWRLHCVYYYLGQNFTSELYLLMSVEISLVWIKFFQLC